MSDVWRYSSHFAAMKVATNMLMRGGMGKDKRIRGSEMDTHKNWGKRDAVKLLVFSLSCWKSSEARGVLNVDVAQSVSVVVLWLSALYARNHSLTHQ